MTQWCIMVLVLIIGAPMEGSCNERKVLNRFKPSGPAMCELKCQLTPLCCYYVFDQDSLDCVMYEKKGIGKGENINCGDEEISEGKTTELGVHRRTERTLTEMPRNMKNLIKECHQAKCRDVHQCLTNRRDQFRCINPVSDKVSAVTKDLSVGFDPVSTLAALSTGQDECSLCSAKIVRINSECRCEVGCSKKATDHKTTCHRVCDVYSRTFSLFKGRRIANHTLKTTKWLYEKACFDEKNFLCRTVIVRNFPVKYYLLNVTWLDVKETDRIFDSNYQLFQRNCN